MIRTKRDRDEAIDGLIAIYDRAGDGNLVQMSAVQCQNLLRVPPLDQTLVEVLQFEVRREFAVPPPVRVITDLGKGIDCCSSLIDCNDYPVRRVGRKASKQQRLADASQGGDSGIK